VPFGVSRKTGYKILERYNSCGLEGLTDRSRRPYRHANQLPVQIETLIVRSKQERPHWGAPKIRERLARLYPDIHTPAISTVHAVLDRHGLVKRRGRRRNKATGTPLSTSDQPNDLWCADYKGEFMLADRRYCYPLTITDFASRYLIACEALQSTKEAYAFTVFENVFKEFGLPNAIRTDNGVPFASPNALFNLSKLPVWWLRLGIAIERIKPGNPQQNGRHERMHLTLKLETTKPAARNFLQQQAKFDDFVECYNNERPHQALDMQCPAQRYRPSLRPYRGLPGIDIAEGRRSRSLRPGDRRRCPISVWHPENRPLLLRVRVFIDLPLFSGRRTSLALVLIDEGGKFLGRPRGEGLLEKAQERGYASAQQSARRVERPEGDFRSVDVTPVNKLAGGQVVTHERHGKARSTYACADRIADHDDRREAKHRIDHYPRFSAWSRYIPGGGQIARPAHHGRNGEIGLRTGQGRARHDHEPVAQEDPSDEAFIRIRIYPYHQVIAFFDHVDRAVFRRDLEPDLRIFQRERRGQLSHRGLREEQRRADPQPASRLVPA
jgi:putative transposase